MAASKPIPWLYKIITPLYSLNNNFGTLLALVLGCFPLDIQPFRTMSDYSKFRKLKGPALGLVQKTRPTPMPFNNLIIALPIATSHR